MSEIQNRPRLNPQFTGFKKFFMIILTFVTMFLFPLPSLMLISMGLNLRPHRKRWIFYGLLGIVGTLLSIPLYIAFSDVPFFVAPQLLMIIYILQMRVIEEYVIRYNALVDSGYFLQEARKKAANLQRHEDEILADAKRNAEKLSPHPKGRTVVRHAQPVQQSAEPAKKPASAAQQQASPFAQAAKQEAAKQPSAPQSREDPGESPFAQVVRQRAASAKKPEKTASPLTYPPQNEPKPEKNEQIGRKLDL